MSFELFEYKIEDLGKVTTGKTPPSKMSDAFSTQGIPFVTPKDMDGRRLIDKTERYLSSQGVEAVRNCLLPQNSIAVSCIGSDMGKTALLPVESITNQQINSITVDLERFNYKYVYYYLSTLQDEFKAIAGGSATPILNKGHFSQFNIYLPVKFVQNKIALMLDSLDVKIEINTKINQTLEQMAQALFKSWFVDFEPVKAKMAVLEAGGSQEEATLAAMTAISGKDADALVVFEREHPEQYAELKAKAVPFPSAMQECELGGIPAGWNIANIKSLVTNLSKGTTPAKKDVSPEENESVNFLKVKDVSNGGSINFTNLDKISKRVHGVVLKRSVLQSGDILFSIAGTIGRVSVVTNELLPCNCNQAIAFVRLKDSSSHLNLIRLNLQSKKIQQEVESKVVQGVQANLSLTSLGELEVVLPTKEVLKIFNDIINPIWKEQLSITGSSRSLTQLRDTLLPKLLSGEITLPEAEQAVSEAENV